jgi:hypothetical protein
MADEVDYDYIYKKLERNYFNCGMIVELRCLRENSAGKNSHVCLCSGRLCKGVNKSQEILKQAYGEKAIGLKLKAILE